LENTTNNVRLRGVLASPPRFSHAGRNELFYIFTLSVERLSGTPDHINIIARSDLIDCLEIEESSKIEVAGELRSFNNKSGRGSRLVITVFAYEISFTEGEDINCVELCGALCKPPNLRRTPMGRDICDLMLAVPRRYGRSDYLPCIAWGKLAEEVSGLGVGERISLMGRIQSRKYIKSDGADTAERTAFEVSVVSLEE
jgi:single-strand DNA-binding protein